MRPQPFRAQIPKAKVELLREATTGLGLVHVGTVSFLESRPATG